MLENTNVYFKKENRTRKPKIVTSVIIYSELKSWQGKKERKGERECQIICQFINTIYSFLPLFLNMEI